MRNYDALMDYIADGSRFRWGSNDCVLFANGATIAMSGRDRVKEAGLKWDGVRDALEIVEAKGGLRSAVSEFLTEIEPSKAMRGDWVLVAGRDGDLVTVCEGETLVAPSDKGLIRFPRAHAITAWSAI